MLTPNHYLVGQLGRQLAPQVTDDIVFKEPLKTNSEPGEVVLEAMDGRVSVNS